MLLEDFASQTEHFRGKGKKYLYIKKEGRKPLSLGLQVSWLRKEVKMIWMDFSLIQSSEEVDRMESMHEKKKKKKEWRKRKTSVEEDSLFCVGSELEAGLDSTLPSSLVGLAGVTLTFSFFSPISAFLSGASYSAHWAIKVKVK